MAILDESGWRFGSMTIRTVWSHCSPSSRDSMSSGPPSEKSRSCYILHVRYIESVLHMRRGVPSPRGSPPCPCAVPQLAVGYSISGTRVACVRPPKADRTHRCLRGGRRIDVPLPRCVCTPHVAELGGHTRHALHRCPLASVRTWCRLRGPSAPPSR